MGYFLRSKCISRDCRLGQTSEEADEDFALSWNHYKGVEWLRMKKNDITIGG